MWETIEAPTLPAAAVREPTLLFVTRRGFSPGSVIRYSPKKHVQISLEDVAFEKKVKEGFEGLEGLA